MKIKLLCVAGARPNFMKLAPLVDALDRDPGFAPFIVHTGQHYDDRMSGQFFRDLGMPAPKHNLNVGSGSHAQQTAEIMKRFEPVLVEEEPDAVLVVGDVNSTSATVVPAGITSGGTRMESRKSRMFGETAAPLRMMRG